MIKDEVGFLSEWTAFYEMMGFSRIIFFDNNSSTSLAELDPWLESGFAEIVTNWWDLPTSSTSSSSSSAVSPSFFSKDTRKRYNDMMKLKYLSEVYCKKRAVELGYEIFVSLDLDEYLFPPDASFSLLTSSSSASSISSSSERFLPSTMDALYDWFISTKRHVLPIPKLNFNPVPHVLEPINLLTIEAYQTRMKDANRMNYYKNISPKIALWFGNREDMDGSNSNSHHKALKGKEEAKGKTGEITEDFNNKTLEYMIHCCDFHGCGNYGFYRPCGNVLKDGSYFSLVPPLFCFLFVSYRAMEAGRKAFEICSFNSSHSS
jgi:hypothetical protein